MNKSLRRFSFLLFLSLSLSPFVFSSDAIDSVIEDSKKEIDQWEEPADELPLSILIGDQSSIELYSSVYDFPSEMPLCQNIEFDEILGDQVTRESVNEVLIPVLVKRVKNYFSEKCLVRPHDEFIAVGKGWQTKVYVQEFFAKKEFPFCPDKEQFNLRARFEESLPEAPLFFSTDPELKEGDNHFFSFDTMRKVDVSSATFIALKKKVSFIEDYSLSAVELNMPNCDRLILLNRINVSPDDAGFPSQIIFSEKGEALDEVIHETVQKGRASGHLKLDGGLDFNSDGNLDLVVHGDDSGCVFSVIFEGLSVGFQVFNVPRKMCHC